MGNLLEQKNELQKANFRDQNTSGREKLNEVKKMSQSLKEKNLYVKQAMAEELKRLGLTEGAIARQLNLTI